MSHEKRPYSNRVTDQHWPVRSFHLIALYFGDLSEKEIQNILKRVCIVRT